MNSQNLFTSYFFDRPSRDLTSVPVGDRGKIYVDVPHRFFGSVSALKAYVKDLGKIGANVLLLLPHFQPSFSEYVVKSYEKPCPLFGDWNVFSEFMKFVETLGMDRMIDIPFNHADWQAENLQRSWFKDHQSNGVEAGADDTDADDQRVRINWGAYVLDNGNPDLINYWVEKIIRPHVKSYHVNAVRIDAAWGLDRAGLARIVGETKKIASNVWFVAENLGMDKLINLADSGIAAGAERYFNNMYWFSKGRAIPSDIYCFNKRSGGKPTCTIFSSHDVLMPAMKALANVRAETYGAIANDKALHRQIVERDGIHSLADVSPQEREAVVHLMKLDFVLAAFMSTDLMFVAGAERGLIERVDVLRSGPGNFALGHESDLPAFMGSVIRMKFSDPLFNRDGKIFPFGDWARGKKGVRGYVRKTGKRTLLVAVNTDLEHTADCPVPASMRRAKTVGEYSTSQVSEGTGAMLNHRIALQPGRALVMIAD